MANGAAAECQSYSDGNNSSLKLVPAIRGTAHYEADLVEPFAIGDVDPGGAFVHVFDEKTLNVVMAELDTITDFTSYLVKKERFFRSGRFLSAAGEEELVAHYMTHMNGQHEHDFTQPDGTEWGAEDKVVFSKGSYANLVRNPRYLAKKHADEVSYSWDRLITVFTAHMLDGTSLVPDGQSAEISELELGVRHMALLPRFERRSYAAGVLQALEEGQKTDKFMRAFIDERSAKTGFFYLTVKVPRVEVRGGYQGYRALRTNLLQTYALNLLRKFPHLKCIVGIASEPKPDSPEMPGSSEDLVYVEVGEWTDELLAELEERKKSFGIDQPGNQRYRAVSDREFPEIALEPENPKLSNKRNRKQRRAFASERWRQNRKSR